MLTHTPHVCAVYNALFFGDTCIYYVSVNITMHAGVERSLDVPHNMCRVWHSFAVHFVLLPPPTLSAV